jgi:F420H(2)-dependent quinone reductase
MSRVAVPADRTFAGFARNFAVVAVLAAVGFAVSKGPRGRLRQTPMICLMDHDVSVVMPANAGHRRPPAWWLNLKAVGTGQVRIGAQCFQVRPRVIVGAEYARILSEFGRICRSADEYARLASRPLPLFVLVRT